MPAERFEVPLDSERRRRLVEIASNPGNPIEVAQELADKMIEGYREMAAFNRELAEAAWPAISEVMLRND